MEDKQIKKSFQEKQEEYQDYSELGEQNQLNTASTRILEILETPQQTSSKKISVSQPRNLSWKFSNLAKFSIQEETENADNKSEEIVNKSLFDQSKANDGRRLQIDQNVQQEMTYINIQNDKQNKGKELEMQEHCNDHDSKILTKEAPLKLFLQKFVKQSINQFQKKTPLTSNNLIKRAAKKLDKSQTQVSKEQAKRKNQRTRTESQKNSKTNEVKQISDLMQLAFQTKNEKLKFNLGDFFKQQNQKLNNEEGENESDELPEDPANQIQYFVKYQNAKVLDYIFQMQGQNFKDLDKYISNKLYERFEKTKFAEKLIHFNKEERYQYAKNFLQDTIYGRKCRLELNEGVQLKIYQIQSHPL